MVSSFVLSLTQYPDGSVSTTEPTDGYIFRYNKDGVTMEFMWDGMLKYWYPRGACGLTHGGSIAVSQPKCECGARHTSFPQLHLRFCPLHTD